MHHINSKTQFQIPTYISLYTCARKTNTFRPALIINRDDGWFSDIMIINTHLYGTQHKRPLSTLQGRYIKKRNLNIQKCAIETNNNVIYALKTTWTKAKYKIYINTNGKKNQNTCQKRWFHVPVLLSPSPRPSPAIPAQPKRWFYVPVLQNQEKRSTQKQHKKKQILKQGCTWTVT